MDVLKFPGPGHADQCHVLPGSGRRGQTTGTTWTNAGTIKIQLSAGKSDMISSILIK